jgi:uncharacterized protein (TIGR00725 family)
MRYIAVIGPGDEATVADLELARQVGALLADRGAVLVGGGLGGVMAAACQGAVEHGGLTVGLLPGDDREAGNPYLSVALPTGIGELRNGLVVRASDALIAIGGSWGTLSEIALAMRTGKPVVVLNGWKVEGRLSGRADGLREAVLSPEQAVEEALRLGGSLCLTRQKPGYPASRSCSTSPRSRPPCSGQGCQWTTWIRSSTPAAGR